MKKGSSRIEPGAWSLEIATYFNELIEKSRTITRDKVAKATGISKGRLPQLLNGEKALYLEDVNALCDFFNIDLLALFKIIKPRVSKQEDEKKIPKSVSPIYSKMKKPREENFRLVAHKSDIPVGTENDEGFI